MFYCDYSYIVIIHIQNIQIFYGVPVMFIGTCHFWSVNILCWYAVLWGLVCFWYNSSWFLRIMVFTISWSVCDAFECTFGSASNVLIFVLTFWVNGALKHILWRLLWVWNASFLLSLLLLLLLHFILWSKPLSKINVEILYLCHKMEYKKVC